MDSPIKMHERYLYMVELHHDTLSHRERHLVGLYKIKDKYKAIKKFERWIKLITCKEAIVIYKVPYGEYKTIGKEMLACWKVSIRQDDTIQTYYGGPWSKKYKDS